MMLNNRNRVSSWQRANKTPAHSLTINNRHLGERGALSMGFGSNSGDARAKLQLRRMIAQANSNLYSQSPIAKRRLQQQIAVKAGNLYGMDARRLMSGLSAGRPRSCNGVCASDHYGLRDKMKVTKTAV